MFKLKIINKPKMIKLKCGFSFPNIVLANLQEKETTPTKEMQQIIADQQYDGLSKVVVNAIPDEYIIPSGEIEINANGTYNVTDKASAKVNVPVKTLTTKTITANGTYNATDDNVDGYSQVTVETSGVDINDYFKPTISHDGSGGWKNTLLKFRSPLTIVGTTAESLFYQYPLSVAPEMDTSNITNMKEMFSYSKIINAPTLNTSNVYRPRNYSMGGTQQMFYNCRELISVPEYDFGKNNTTYQMFRHCNKLTTLGGFKNYGKGLKDVSSLENYSALDFNDCTLLTHDSLMNIINKLYDIATEGFNTQKLVLGSTNLAKLTAEEIAIATNKGFSVS